MHLQELVEVAHCEEASVRRDPLVALRESQFVPFFQPLITLRTGQLEGFEVLARWEHPVEGTIAPYEFISLAERDGWIGALMQQILEKAFAAISIVSDTVTLAINISPLQLRDPGLPEQFRSIAKASGFALNRLVVEITESALIDDISGAARIVAELKAMGCKLALDDFGTGYSSLSHVQVLPFDELKVDRSFVSSMTERRESRKIVSSVVGLGQSLGLATVAEGIETQEQAEMMLWLGCELGQGYFFGRPMPAADLASFVMARREKIVAKDLRVSKRIFAANLESSPSQRLAQLEAVYDGAPVGLAFIDKNLRYLNINKRLADMNGASIEAHLGSLVSEMIPDLFPAVEKHIHRAMRGEIVQEVEAQDERAQRTRLYSFHPAFDEVGEVVGVSFSAMDVTERKRTENALKMREAHYQSMIELSPGMFWIMDTQGRNLGVAPRLDKRTGAVSQQTDEAEWLHTVHPDDMRRTIRAISESRRTETSIDVEYRADDRAGGWRWKRSRGLPRFDVAGRVVCWYGSTQDIEAPSGQVLQRSRGQRAPMPAPEDAKVAGELSAAERRERALLELDILDTPAEAEFDDLVVLASELCQTPISQVSLVTSKRQWIKASTGVAASEAEISISFCAHAIQQQGLFVVEDAAQDERFKQNPLVLGAPQIRFYAGVPLCVGDGTPVGALCVIDQVPRRLTAGQAKALTILGQQVQTQLELRSERKKLLAANAQSLELAHRLKLSNENLVEANLRLEQLATVDALTGLLNRRAFEEKMEAEFRNAGRRSRSLSLLVLDLNDFKRRNDALGHAAGDDVLRKVGELIRGSIRAGDSAARIGGDEFAIILPETTRGRAKILAKRIESLVESRGKELTPISISVGAASRGPATTCWEELFTEADLAMYEAKRAAKNKKVMPEVLYVA